MRHATRVAAIAIAMLMVACPAKSPTPPLRSLAGYPAHLDAGASPAECQAFEPLLPSPLGDDDVLAQFVGLPATRHTRKCTDRDFHPCDPVGPDDCKGPGWDKTWSAPLRRKDLVLFQRYWTVISVHGVSQCRFVGEVRTVGADCQGERDVASAESVEAPDLARCVDLLTGEPVREPVNTAAGTTGHWKH